MRTIGGSTLEPLGKLFVKDLSLYFPKQKRVGSVNQPMSSTTMIKKFGLSAPLP